MHWFFAIGVGILLMSMSANTNLPRGLRNHNPLNIRWDGRTQWDGMTGADDAGFVIFKSSEYGYRAATRILMSYARRGVVTLEEIITTWAPPSDNNPTQAYIKNVENWSGIPRTAEVEPHQYPVLLAAMERMENGNFTMDMALISQGVSMAYA